MCQPSKEKNCQPNINMILEERGFSVKTSRGFLIVRLFKIENLIAISNIFRN